MSLNVVALEVNAVEAKVHSLTVRCTMYRAGKRSLSLAGTDLLGTPQIAPDRHSRSGR